MSRLRDLLPRWHPVPALVGWARGLSGVRSGAGPRRSNLRTTQPGRLAESSQADGRAHPALQAVVARAARQREWARAQTRFVANASHQLKAPLTLLRAQVDHALMQTDIAAMRELVARLYETTDCTNRLVDQLLALARSEPGRRLEMTDVDLGALVREIVVDFLPMARAKNIDLGCEFAVAARVRGEALLLRESIVNLVHNALSYTPRGGSVTVSVLWRHGRPGLRVVDNGPGIAPHERERVLERFYRLPGSQAQGSGLGLAIVKEICARHGIGLTLLDAPGRGLCVDMRWPTSVKGPRK